MIKKSDVKQGYYNSTELTLKCYPLLKGSIHDLEKRIGEIKLNSGMKAITYDSVKVSTNRVYSMVEETALRNLDEIEEIKEQMATLTRKMGRLDDALGSLEPHEKEIIKGRYFHGMKWENISMETLYHRNQCMHLSKQAIAKLTIYFYGEKAIVDNNLMKQI